LVPKGRVNTGAVVSLLFNSWKLFSHSSDHTHFLFFLVSWVKGVAIRENPSIVSYKSQEATYFKQHMHIKTIH
jgi:hypothetical protein